MINCLHYPAPSGGAEILLIMLPGAGIEAAAFATNGMIAIAHEHAVVDIIVAHPDMGLYLEDGVTDILHSTVIAPALARGVTRIWLLGISLGGMGALLYASAYQQNIEGIFLLAPFLGTRGTTAEILRAGGLAAWSPANSTATEPEQRLLAWLQTHLTTECAPVIHLGYGVKDRFAPAHQLLAQHLEHVTTTPGGHDWPSWRALWQQLAPVLGRCHAR